MSGWQKERSTCVGTVTIFRALSSSLQRCFWHLHWLGVTEGRELVEWIDRQVDGQTDRQMRCRCRYR